jgi:hypothetical protein
MSGEVVHPVNAAPLPTDTAGGKPTPCLQSAAKPAILAPIEVKVISSDRLITVRFCVRQELSAVIAPTPPNASLAAAPKGPDEL